MSKLAHSNQETMDEIEAGYSTTKENVMLASHTEWCERSFADRQCTCTHRFDGIEPPDWYVADKKYRAALERAENNNQILSTDCTCRANNDKETAFKLLSGLVGLGFKCPNATDEKCAPCRDNPMMHFTERKP